MWSRGNFDVQRVAPAAAAAVVALQGLVGPSGVSTADLGANPTELPIPVSCLSVNGAQQRQGFSAQQNLYPEDGSPKRPEQIVAGVATATVKVNGYSKTPEGVGISVGSGSILPPKDGAYYVLTNAHVVADRSKLDITLYNQRVVPVQVVATDPIGDIAVLRIMSKGPFSHINLGNSNLIKPGASVFSIGNGGIVPNSVLDGIISGLPNGLMRYVKDPNDPTASTRGISSTGLFQTNLNVNPGDSGGPVFNDRGEVIGIVTIGNRQLRLAFVIPSNYIIEKLPSMLNGQPVTHAVIGVDLKNLSLAEVSESVKKKEVPPWVFDVRTKRGEKGALISGVAEDGPAKGKLLPGDIIVAVNGTEIKNEAEARTLISKNESPNPISLTVLRRDELFECKISTVPRPRDAHPLLAATPLPSLPTL